MVFLYISPAVLNFDVFFEDNLNIQKFATLLLEAVKFLMIGCFTVG
ncbi:hypothetical Protein YC6258_01292 [Gynuella sunshinyii YC6258]|uniref:Uncharacterized protein n=1 Tax=Gynuella sunshinyii YC6258 TaxID=1445510 RepID=A0A0C5V1D9_9GAMM|nr:hypothetical Protein YC6258_01292 [Gynuella sunshinyii YC6258]